MRFRLKSSRWCSNVAAPRGRVHSEEGAIITTVRTVARAGIVLAAILLTLTGCGKQDSRGSSGSSSGGKKQIFVMIPKGVHPYYEPCYEGFKDAAAKYGIEQVQAQKDVDALLKGRPFGAAN